MKKTVLAAAFAALASGAQAQTATQTINLQAVVPSYCKLGTLTGQVTPAASPSATDATTVVFDYVVSTGTVTATPSAGATHTYAVECNGNAQLEMTANPLTSTAAPTAATGFSNKIGYTATASGTGVLAAAYVATTTTAAVTPTAVAANNAKGNLDIVVSAATQQGGASVGLPMMAGTYNGTLLVKLTPQ